MTGNPQPYSPVTFIQWVRYGDPAAIFSDRGIQRLLAMAHNSQHIGTNVFDSSNEI